MLRRSWLTFAIVIAIVQGVLSLLAVLQHNAVYSELLRQRIAVIAQTTAASFKPIIDLGLPISMIRNGNAIAGRALEMDRAIRAVHVFNPSGVVVYSTENPRPPSVSQEVLQRMRLADGAAWSAESSSDVFSGRTISSRDGGAAGAVVVVYPKDSLETASGAILLAALRAAVLIWLSFSAAAYLLLRLMLASPERAIAQLGSLSRAQMDAGSPAADASHEAEAVTTRGGPFAVEVARLERNLVVATRRYHEAARAIAMSAHDSAGETRIVEPCEAGREAGDGPASPSAPEVASDPSRSLANLLAARLVPLAAIFMTVSAVILGWVILQNVNRSIEPELAARTNLIGTVVSENVQRAVRAGAPIDQLAGAENYFGDMLIQLPEVAYVAVATDRIILQAGRRTDPSPAWSRERKDLRSHPIVHDDKEIGYVIVDFDPTLIAKRFRDVFLDMSVVILVSILVAFEIMILLTSRSLTAALDRLQRLAAMQAVGDFSKRARFATSGAVASLTKMLVERTETLHAGFAQRWKAAGTAEARAALQAARTRYHLSEQRPAQLRVAYFTDVRFALFLFAVADQLPLAFLPLYTRSATNLWPWVEESVLLSLPLVGYLLGILAASPFSRALTERFGVRRLFLASALPMIAAYVGLYLSNTAQEVIFWRTVTGLGYAVVSLACQDYVIDTAPHQQRDRALGMFTIVLFGGVFSGAALGGILADRLGQHNVFLLSAALIALSSFLSAWSISAGRAESAAVRDNPHIAMVLSTLRNGHFAVLVFGLAIPANVLLQAFISYLVALTLDSLGATTADIGRTVMLYFLGIILVSHLGSRFARAGAGRVAAAGAVLAGASLACFVVWPIEAVLVASVFTAGVGHGLVRNAQISLAMTLVETELQRQGPVIVLGALRTFERLGSMMGLLLIAALAGAFGFRAATATIVAWTLVGVALFALRFFAGRAQATAGLLR